VDPIALIIIGTFVVILAGIGLIALIAVLDHKRQTTKTTNRT
jgi:multisubunit Na+/H+ antiporter MnhG subunit